MAELAGYTARVSELFETMDDVQQSKYQKALVSSASIEDNAKGEFDLYFIARFYANIPSIVLQRV